MFERYPQNLTVIELDTVDETFDMGTFTVDKSYRVSKCRVAMYISGSYAPTATAEVLISDDSGVRATSTAIKLDSLDDHFLGRVRFDFPLRAMLSTGNTYTISLKLTGYTPDPNPGAGATYCAVVKNSPSTMGYGDDVSLIDSNCVFHLFNEE